jgi:general secretion pathway protein G
MNESPTTNRSRRHQAGFTLVEIMVVIVILGLLATMVAQSVIGASDEARIKTTETSIRGLADSVKRYYITNGKIPTELAELVSKDNGGPYVDGEEIPKDAWGHDFVLRGENKNDYEIISWGPDGNEGTEDDLSSRKKKE